MGFFLPYLQVARSAGKSTFPAAVAGQSAYGLPLAKYPVQWVAPKEEPAMYLGDSLYPKPGYQTSKMLIPRQFLSYPTNNGTFYGSWRYAELRKNQWLWWTTLTIIMITLIRAGEGGSLNKSWRGHNDSYWYGEKHELLHKIEELQHNLGRMAH
ncbi:unnamed protein product [Oikopleura dioica]|uniref:Uncharacterized protein n=1 Tax=Oikopleura dioica TaxID=34765 RepID=E4YK72_OIKDI|nr:unnamed protein product [Oikopleura dioica]